MQGFFFAFLILTIIYDMSKNKYEQHQPGCKTDIQCYLSNKPTFRQG